MESAAVLRSFQSAVCTDSHLKSLLQRPCMITMNTAAFCHLSKLPTCGGKTLLSTTRHGARLVSCVKASEATVTAKSKGGCVSRTGEPNGAVLSDSPQNGIEKKSPSSATFPNGLEDLISEVCDETKIAELKVKIGTFEVHMKRNINGPPVPAPVVTQTTIPSVPSTSENESTPAVPPPPPKSSSEKVTPFTNLCVEKAAKLAALEATGATGYVIVSSPMVGSFQSAFTRKGKRQAPACKEGDVIKEGKVIGFLDQFGREVPIRSDVDGEVLKVFCTDGEAVGYGDPIIAVLPSFHDIK